MYAFACFQFSDCLVYYRLFYICFFFCLYWNLFHCGLWIKLVEIVFVALYPVTFFTFLCVFVKNILFSGPFWWGKTVGGGIVFFKFLLDQSNCVNFFISIFTFLLFEMLLSRLWLAICQFIPLFLSIFMLDVKMCTTDLSKLFLLSTWNIFFSFNVLTLHFVSYIPIFLGFF